MGVEKQEKKENGLWSFLKSKKKLPLLVGGLLLGVMLLLFGSTGGDEETTAKESDTSAHVNELANYEARVEKELEALCESVAGVSDVDVMVTFSQGYTVSYVKNGDHDPATVGSGSSESALFEMVSPPVISGVGIVCRGGGSAFVESVLVELIATSLGIPSHKVYVTGK